MNARQGLGATGVVLILAVGWWFGAGATHDRPVVVGGPSPGTPRPDSHRIASGADAHAVPETVEATPLATEASAERTLEVYVGMEGRPIPGAEVVALSLTEELERSMHRLSGLTAAESGTAIRLTTGTDGKCRATRPPGRVYLAVNGTGVAPGAMFLDEENDEAIFELSEENTLLGTVRLADGRPAVGAAVVARKDLHHSSLLFGHALNPFRMVGMFFESRAVVGMDGTFVLRQLPLDLIRVRASLDGYSAAVEPQVHIPWQTRVDLVLHPGAASVEGIVAERGTGVRIEGARVEAYAGPPADAAPTLSDVAMTNHEGRFTLDAVRGDIPAFGIRVICSGYGTRVASIEGLSPGSTRDLRIELAKAERLEGRVVSRSGAGARAEIAAYDERTGFQVTYFITKDDGTFRLEHLDPGDSYRFQVFPGAAARPVEVRGVRCRRTTPLEIVLTTLGVLRGQVLADANPVGDGTVRLNVLDGSRRVRETRTAEIDQQGRYSFDLVPEGELRLEASVDGFAPAWVEPVRVDVEAESTIQDLELSRGAVLTGSVIHEETGARLSSVELRIVATRADAYEGVPLELTAVTDDVGRFRFGRIPVAEPLGLQVVDERFAERVIDFEIPVGSTEHRLDAFAIPGVTVELVVIEADGSLVRGITGALGSGGRTQGSQQDPDGVVRFPRVPVGRATAVVSVNPIGVRYQRQIETTTDPVQRIEFRLGGAASIQGVIRDGGRFPGARFSILTSRQGSHQDVAVVTAAANARFEIPGLEPGEHLVVMRAVDGVAQRLGQRMRIELAAGEAREVEFDLGRIAVSGRVEDRHGRPVGGALTLLRRNVDRRELESVSAADGTYRIEAIPAGGPHELIVQAQGFARRVLAVDLSDAEPERGIDVALDPEAIIRVVLDRPEGPPAAATVRCRPLIASSTAMEVRSSEVGEDGVCVVRFAMSGSYLVEVRVPDHFPARAEVACIGGETSEVTLLLRRVGSLEVSVASGDGAGRPGVSMTVIDRLSGDDARLWLDAGWIRSSSGSMSSGSDGRLRIDGLPEGTYDVTASGVTGSAVVVAGSVTSFVLQQH